MQFRKAKDGLTVFIANNGNEYQEHVKPYVVNMCKNRKMVHKKMVVIILDICLKL